MDGFPRNVAQARRFQELSSLEMVINLCLPDWVLMEKLMGRRVCMDCGTGYNIAAISNGMSYYHFNHSPMRRGV
jgi:adenylate kinase